MAENVVEIEIRSRDETAGGVESARRNTGKMLDTLKGAAVAGAAGAGLAAGAVLMDGIGKAMEREKSTRRLGAQLGLDPAETKALGESAGRIYADGFGESFEGVNDAIKVVSQNIGGLSGAELESVTKDVLALSDTFEQDLGGTTAAVGQMIRTGLAKDSQEAMDIIAAGLQSGANKADDLLDTYNEYGTQFRKMGISGAEATGLMAQGLKAGARDADVVADAIKEFSIRAIDGSKATTEGFTALGLSASQMQADLAGGGDRANAALDQTLDRLRAVKDPAERSAIAVQLFGTQAEDLGDALFALDPSEAVAALGDVEGAASAVTEAMGDTAAGRIEKFKRGIENGFVEGLGAALGAAEDFAETAVPVLEGIAEKAAPIADALGPPLAEAATMVTEELVPAMEAYASAILKVYTVLVERLAPIVAPVLEGMVEVIRGALQVTLGLFKVFTAVLTGDWQGAWEGIRDIAQGALRALLAPARLALTALQALFGTMVARVRSHMATFRSALSTGVSALQRIRSAGSTAFGWISTLTSKLSSLGGAFERLRDRATAAVRAIPTPSLPSIPGFAHGGVVGAASGGPRSSWTLVGEGGPELVQLPAGSRVTTAGDSARLMGDKGGGGRVVLEIASSGSRTDDLLLDLLRSAVRVRGGNVQTVIGGAA